MLKLGDIRRVLEAKEVLAQRLLYPRFGTVSVRDGEATSVSFVGVTTCAGGELGIPVEYADEVVLVVGVEKLDVDVLEKVPYRVGGVRVEVIEAGRLWALGAMVETLGERVGKVRPFPGGVSVGAVGCTAGTAGCVVYDSDTGEPLMVTNNHVAGLDWGTCRLGPRLIAKYGELPVLQPGPYDIYVFGPVEDRVKIMCYPDKHCGAVCDVFGRDIVEVYRVGRLYRYVRVYSPDEEGQPRAGTGRNLVDAAVVKLDRPELMLREVLDVGVPGGSVPATVHVVGKVVVKSGRTTGVTCGTVMAVHADVKIWESDTNYAIFTDQIIIESTDSPFAKGGDSGSVVLLKETWPDGTYKTLGLLFAGIAEKVGGRWLACANPATHVEALLRVRFGKATGRTLGLLLTREKVAKLVKGLLVASLPLALVFYTVSRVR